MGKHLKRSLLLAAALVLPLNGCASGITGWIVETRNHQGDVALSRARMSNPISPAYLEEASKAYSLALRVDPSDARARAGAVAVQLENAAQDYRLSKFDDALAAVAGAAKYDPTSVRVAQLRSDIEEARLKREIAVSNYPTYKDSAASLRRAYDGLKVYNARVTASLKRFDYTYDINDLNTAIRQSYDFDEVIKRDTNRLVQFRQLVESGVPESARSGAPVAPPASLLPLP